MEHSYTDREGNGDRGVMDRVKDTATAQLANQKNRATDGLGELAQAVRRTSQPLRESHQDTIAEYVERAADGIERFSTRLRQREIGDLVDEAQRFARRRPALFIGGAFAAGLLTARFLKSSSDQKAQRWNDDAAWRRNQSWRRDEPMRAGAPDRTRPVGPSGGPGYGSGGV
jgi:hypothetical protein